MESINGDTALLLLAYVVKYNDVELPKDFLESDAPETVMINEEEDKYTFTWENNGSE